MSILVAQKPSWTPFSIAEHATDARIAVMLAATLFVGILVYWLSPRAVAACRRLGMVAQVNERSSHVIPTPHGGGFILPLVVVPVALALTWFWPLPFKGYLSVLLIGSLLVAYVGWLDDRHELSARLRLLVHIFAVAIPLVLLPQLFEFLPLAAEKALLLFGWAWFVSLYNFMDGADGLASTEAVALGLGLSILVPTLAPLGLIIAAAAVGLLRVNAPPAKVFMGDVSATWLGYIFPGIYLLAGVDDTVNVAWPLAALPLVFAADATSTLFRRIVQGYAPGEPHKTFWFHRYMALGNSHIRLISRVAILNLTILLCAGGGYAFGYPALGFFAALLVVCSVACYIRAGEKARNHGHRPTK